MIGIKIIEQHVPGERRVLELRIEPPAEAHGIPAQHGALSTEQLLPVLDPHLSLTGRARVADHTAVHVFNDRSAHDQSFFFDRTSVRLGRARDIQQNEDTESDERTERQDLHNNE